MVLDHFLQKRFWATPPLKKINIFDRTHWSRILGFKIGAPQGSNWLKTKKSDGPFWRKSWEDFQKIKGSISKKGLIRFFCFSSSQAQEGPNFKAWYMVLMGPVESVKIFRGRGVLHQICPFFWGGGGVQGLIYILTSAMIVHLISTMSVVWRKGPREKRRPKSGRTLVTHGRISSPFWF